MQKKKQKKPTLWERLTGKNLRVDHAKRARAVAKAHKQVFGGVAGGKSRRWFALRPGIVDFVFNTQG